MIIEKIESICTKNGTNLTALCKEITGSSGNLPTWKKDKIRVDWLRSICIKFNISSDYLLDLSNNQSNENISNNDAEWLSLIHQLPIEAQYEFRGELKGYLKRLNEETVQAPELRQAK